jgi:hypothetical protein
LSEIRFEEGDSERRGIEFATRDKGALSIFIEGSGYEGDWGSGFTLSAGDAKALLTFLEDVVKAP